MFINRVAIPEKFTNDSLIVELNEIPHWGYIPNALEDSICMLRLTVLIEVSYS